MATAPEQLATRLDIVARYSAINYFPITRLLIKVTLTFLFPAHPGLSCACRVLPVQQDEANSSVFSRGPWRHLLSCLLVTLLLAELAGFGLVGSAMPNFFYCLNIFVLAKMFVPPFKLRATAVGSPELPKYGNISTPL